MTPSDARTVIAAAINAIAPEIDLDELDGAAPFAAEADLDSMDLLSLAEALHEAAGIDIGDGDMASGWSLDLLGSRAGPPSPRRLSYSSATDAVVVLLHGDVGLGLGWVAASSGSTPWRSIRIRPSRTRCARPWYSPISVPTLASFSSPSSSWS